ncbi:unnamed protein product [Prorocentrum cordatum]|uniref:Hexosyltransferase n=1 Tax=Prorocentrum cordatum TaxID=2364126 RepID=A0ABN9PJ89_9DINO|nr:unnamed protein product [Polarella glacialis]
MVWRRRRSWPTLAPCLVAAPWLPRRGLADAQSTAEFEDGCESPHWSRVRQALDGGAGSVADDGRGDPSANTVARMVLEEAALEAGWDSAGCEVGRFVLSAWQLVHAGTAERAWHLLHRFGSGFYALEWRPRGGWPLLRALARLRESARADPAQTYPACGCDGLGGDGASEQAAVEAELLEATASGPLLGASPGGARAAARALPLAAAAELLQRAAPGRTCPLAVATAHLVLAAALAAGAPGGGLPPEAERLLRLAERAAKGWEPERLPFLDLLTTAWPVLDLLALAEQLALGESAGRGRQPAAGLVARGAPPPDPRSPRCPPPDRAALAAGLEAQRVEVVVVFGRRERVEILHRYLLRNLRVNGGVVDRVSFVVYLATTQDLVWLDELVAAHAPVYVIPPVTGRRLAKFYSICTEPETVYVKIDDDVVFLADETIPEMVRERMRGRCGIVSANVVNHAILSAVHQDIGAIRTFFPLEDATSEGAVTDAALPEHGPRHWQRVDDAMPILPVEKHAQSDCVWRRWECAAWMHESFLSRLEDGTQCAYDFGWHDFHAHGHGSYRGDRFVPFQHTRWSINMIAFTAEDLKEVDWDDLAEDDESELAVMVPHRTNSRGCAVGRALAAHFSYSKQEEGLERHTDLLARYDALSRTMDGESP